jgi:copper chaperone CopZ
VSADLGTGSVTITSDTDVDSAVIAAAVDEAGYELAP